MTHQPNKHFNTYKVMERSEMLEETGELSGMICLFHLQPPTIWCSIQVTVADSEILDAGEREHEEMNDITAIWLLKRHKVTHVWKKVVIPVQSFWKSGIYVNRGRMFSMDIEQRFD